MPIRVENNRAKLEKKMKDKPKMEYKPKMAYGDKPKSAGLKALAAKNPELEYVGKAKMMDVRAKMAMPKMVDGKNFPKMAQDMASALVPKMDYAKMYKTTKYHDGPKMYGKPKMTNDDKKKKKSRFTTAYEKQENMVDNPFYGDKKYQGFTLDKNARESKQIPQVVRDNIYERARKKAKGIVGRYDK